MIILKLRLVERERKKEKTNKTQDRTGRLFLEDLLPFSTRGHVTIFQVLTSAGSHLNE
jgi:hypothetical protein